MAIIDQDNFSNISWQIETDNGVDAARPSAPMPNIDAEPPSSEDQRHGQDLQRQDPGLSGDILECTVSEPHKESDGTKDAFVSYLITSNVCACIWSRYRCSCSCGRRASSHLISLRLTTPHLTTNLLSIYAVNLPFLPETDFHLPPTLYRLSLPCQDTVQGLSGMCRPPAAR